MTNNEILRGWVEIEQMFPVYAPNVVRQKYGKEMLNKGFVFKSRVGSNRRKCEVWTYRSLVVAFISKKQADNGKV